MIPGLSCGAGRRESCARTGLVTIACRHLLVVWQQKALLNVQDLFGRPVVRNCAIVNATFFFRQTVVIRLNGDTPQVKLMHRRIGLVGYRFIAEINN